MTQTAFSEYGRKDGKLVVYFHGVPGATQECSIFDSDAKRHGLRIICFDRFSIDGSIDRESYYQQIASRINSEAAHERVDFIGFSIGAHVALEVGALLGKKVRYIHLISAAAPLGAGDFVESMAGGLVFKLAKEKPFVFSLLSQFQTALAYLAPGVLFQILFSSSAGKDEALTKSRDFRRHITAALKHCFRHRVGGYMRDIDFYVNWQSEFAAYTSSIKIWHGTEDTWSPISMASYLSSAIPGASNVRAMDGLSHYSCLYEVAALICESLNRLPEEQIV